MILHNNLCLPIKRDLNVTCVIGTQVTDKGVNYRKQYRRCPQNSFDVLLKIYLVHAQGVLDNLKPWRNGN